jgi:hypothetical protein
MQKRLGIEAALTNDFAEQDRLSTLIIDKDNELLIVKEEDWDQFIHLLPSNASITETYSLLELENPEVTDLFTDYGFTSEFGRTYLYADTPIAFSIVRGNPTEVAMALLQFEEYLIAKEKLANETIYFLDKNYEDLIKKVANAYAINVHIFDLDK